MHSVIFTLIMKKIILLAATAVAVAMTIFSCTPTDVQKIAGYSYVIKTEKAVWYVEDERNAITADLYAAIGYKGDPVKIYLNNQDNQMINACNAVKAKYEGRELKTVYLKFVLYRSTSNTPTPQADAAIATYEFGDALKRDWVWYNYTSNHDEVYAEFQKVMRDETVMTRDEAILYSHGMMALSNDWKNLWNGTTYKEVDFLRPYADTEANKNAMQGWVEKVYTDYYANEQYATYMIWDDITYKVTKENVITAQTSEILSKTFPKTPKDK